MIITNITADFVFKNGSDKYRPYEKMTLTAMINGDVKEEFAKLEATAKELNDSKTNFVTEAHTAGSGVDVKTEKKEEDTVQPESKEEEEDAPF